MKARILVVDDEVTAREELCEALEDAGFKAVGFGDGQQALEEAEKTSYPICISDIRMPGMDGITLLKRLAQVSPETMVVIITAYGDMETAIEALRHGATDYVLKPLLFEDIISKVKRLMQHRALEYQVRNLRRIAESRTETSGRRMVGESGAMTELLRLVSKVAPTSSNVLITGESGTGKELIARAIHEASPRAKAPFVPINCAAIPETLLESELFGHVKGSFTGAVGNKDGLLQTAGDGTIFLDELGDMPLSIQAKLLRAIEAKEIQPVGSVRRIPIQARILAATNKELKNEIERGDFREDLYFRMAVVEICVPPLRDRREDIPVLVKHFIRKYNVELGRECLGVESQGMRLLVGYEWPGNIRELENCIERALILSDGELIQAEDLPGDIRRAAPISPDSCLKLAPASRRFEIQHISKVLTACENDKRKAAQMLGISLSSLYRKLEAGPVGAK